MHSRFESGDKDESFNIPQRTATHYNTLQHTSTHVNTHNNSSQEYTFSPNVDPVTLAEPSPRF